MGLFSKPDTPAQPPPPPPPPPAANPPTFASSSTQAAGAAAKARMQAAAGAGFAGTLATGAQGATPAPTANKSLLGQ